MSAPGPNPLPQLTDEVATLAALEARRDKTRALKQGMMQKLLTGRTSLI
jgi:type I restriction enzyme S subunit